jgi:hypothetical protein
MTGHPEKLFLDLRKENLPSIDNGHPAFPSPGNQWGYTRGVNEVHDNRISSKMIDRERESIALRANWRRIDDEIIAVDRKL